MGKSATDIAAKWAANTSGAVERYKKGVSQTTVDPTAKAIERQDDYVAGVTEAASSGKWAAGLRRAGRQKWLDGALNKGAANIATGVRFGQSKQAEFHAHHQPFVEQEAARIKQALPGRGNGRARMEAMFDANSNYRRPGG